MLIAPSSSSADEEEENDETLQSIKESSDVVLQKLRDMVCSPSLPLIILFLLTLYRTTPPLCASAYQSFYLCTRQIG